MPRGLEHAALGFEDAVFATALLVVVVDDEDGERSGHGWMIEARTLQLDEVFGRSLPLAGQRFDRSFRLWFESVKNVAPIMADVPSG